MKSFACLLDEMKEGRRLEMIGLLAFYCIFALGYDVLVKILELLFPIYGLYLQETCKCNDSLE